MLAKASEQRNYLEFIRNRYSHLRIAELPMFTHEVRGIDRLTEVARILFPD